MKGKTYAVEIKITSGISVLKLDFPLPISFDGGLAGEALAGSFLVGLAMDLWEETFMSFFFF